MQHKMKSYQKLTREDFMKFFRDNEKLNELSVDDRIEIFRTILIGSSDLTKDLLNEILAKNTGQSLSKVELDVDRDYWMSAEEACAYGLVDKVIEKR